MQIAPHPAQDGVASLGIFTTPSISEMEPVSPFSRGFSELLAVACSSRKDQHSLTPELGLASECFSLLHHDVTTLVIISLKENKSKTCCPILKLSGPLHVALDNRKVFGASQPLNDTVSESGSRH